MANDCKRQPLLSGLIDPPQEAPKKSTSKGRYRHSRSAPSAEPFFEQANNGGLFLGPKSIPNLFRPLFRQVLLLLILYLGVGTFCFYMVRHQIKGDKTNEVLDALYFSVVTMTTVGYGDLLPNSATTKLLACAFVFTGMTLVGLFLSKASDYLVEKQERLLVEALHIHHKVREVEILKEMETNRVKYKLLMTMVLLLVFVFVGTIFLWKVEKLSLVDSFYCVCSTITTLGYGDKSFSTKTGRVFALFWIVTSTICVAQFFLYLAEFNTEQRQRSLAKWVLTRRTTFVDLEAADLDCDGHVGAAEFIIYKLKEMGKISQEDIAVVLEEFEALDVDRSGTLSPSDLVLAQSDC